MDAKEAWDIVKNKGRESREKAGAMQVDLEKQIATGLMFDPSGTFIPLSQLDLEHTRGIISPGEIRKLLDSDPQNEQMENVRQKLEDLIDQSPNIGIYDNKGKRLQSAYLLNSLLDVEGFLKENFPQIGSFIVLSSVPIGDMKNPDPVVFRTVNNGKMEYVPWKSTVRFPNVDTSEVLADPTVIRKDRQTPQSAKPVRVEIDRTVTAND